MFMSRRKLKFGYKDLNVYDARGLENPLSEGDEPPKGKQIIDINDESLALEIDIHDGGKGVTVVLYHVDENGNPCS